MGIFDRWIGGPDGGGFFDFLAKGGGFFAPLAGGAGLFGSLGSMGEGSGGFYAAEGGGFSAAEHGGFGNFFSRFFTVAEEWFNVRAADEIFSHLTGSASAFKTTWAALDEMARKAVGTVAGAHVFIGQQLEKHQHLDRVKPLWEEYKKLGSALPGEELINKIFRALGTALHPDRNPGMSDELSKTLNGAVDSLRNAEYRAVYESTVRHNPGIVEELLAGLGKTTSWWEKTRPTGVPEVDPKMLQLGGGEAKKLSGLRKWFSELSPNKRIGLAFGAVATVALGTYFTVRTVENWRNKAKQKQKTDASPAESHQDTGREMAANAR